MQIKCLSNGSYSLKGCHNPFGKGFQPPRPYGKIPVEHLRFLHGASIRLLCLLALLLGNIDAKCRIGWDLLKSNLFRCQEKFSQGCPSCPAMACHPICPNSTNHPPSPPTVPLMSFMKYKNTRTIPHPYCLICNKKAYLGLHFTISELPLIQSYSK